MVTAALQSQGGWHESLLCEAGVWLSLRGGSVRAVRPTLFRNRIENLPQADLVISMPAVLQGRARRLRQTVAADVVCLRNRLTGTVSKFSGEPKARSIVDEPYRSASAIKSPSTSSLDFGKTRRCLPVQTIDPATRERQADETRRGTGRCLGMRSATRTSPVR